MNIKKVTATDLAQNTKMVVKQAIQYPDKPVIVYNHGKPEVVIVDYQEWKRITKPKRRATLEELRKYMFFDPKIKNSTKLIREMRDAE